MYILQQTLFSFEELMEIELNEKAPIFFSALDLRPYAKELRSLSPQGAIGYNRVLAPYYLDLNDQYATIHSVSQKCFIKC